jgi:hypothetical protein
MFIVHDEGDLSLPIGNPVVSSNPHELISHGRHQCNPVHVIDVRESMNVALGEFGVGSEKAQVNRFLR